MGFLGTVKGAISEVPDESYEVPLGSARVAREGRDVTLVGIGATVHLALDAADRLKEEGIDAEVIDLRSLVPLDRETVLSSARKTGRVLAVDDDYLSYGVTAEILALVSERAFASLKCAPQRLAYPDVPPPYAPAMERFALPDATKMVHAVQRMISDGSSK